MHSFSKNYLTKLIKYSLCLLFCVLWSLSGCASANKQFEDAELENAQGAEDRALKNYLAAAEKGYPPAMTRVGEYYLNGISITKNPKEACQWFERAAKQHDPKALYYLGMCYIDGNGMPQNTQKGFEYVHQSAIAEYSVAQVMLATCYMDGLGTPKDPELGFAWYKRAAEQGNIDGAFFTGSCFMVGAGVEPNINKACHWFDIAAKGGIHDAIELTKLLCHKEEQTNTPSNCLQLTELSKLSSAKQIFELARCYDLGTDINENDTLACELYRDALEMGYEEAKQYVEQCSTQNN